MGDRGREHEDRGSEDGRDDSGSIEFEREVRRLPAGDLGSCDALGVLDRDTSVGTFKEADHTDDEDHESNKQKKLYELVREHLNSRDDRTRKRGDDAGVDQKANPISDPVFGHLFPEPHQENSPGGESEDRHKDERSVVIDDQAGDILILAAKPHRDSDPLDHREKDGAVAGVLVDLLSSDLSLAVEASKRRDRDGKKLDDDGGADVGHDAERKDRHPFEGSPRKHIDKT